MFNFFLQEWETSNIEFGRWKAERNIKFPVKAKRSQVRFYVAS